MIKQAVAIIEAYHLCQLLTKFYQTFFCEVFKSIWRNQCESSMWISFNHTSCNRQILRKKMTIKWSSASAIYRLQENVWFIWYCMNRVSLCNVHVILFIKKINHQILCIFFFRMRDQQLKRSLVVITAATATSNTEAVRISYWTPTVHWPTST